MKLLLRYYLRLQLLFVFSIFYLLLNMPGKLKLGAPQMQEFGSILEALKPLLKENSLTLTITENTIELGGYLILESTATLSNGVDNISVKAQAGINPDRKGMDIAQSFGSSSSYAKKYALRNLFLLDDTKDVDATTNPKEVGNTKPVMNKQQFEKAKEYILSGGDIKTIQDKYFINTQHLADLKSIKNEK